MKLLSVTCYQKSIFLFLVCYRCNCWEENAYQSTIVFSHSYINYLRFRTEQLIDKIEKRVFVIIKSLLSKNVVL